VPISPVFVLWIVLESVGCTHGYSYCPLSGN
jgi:hypothetical protein